MAKRWVTCAAEAEAGVNRSKTTAGNETIDRHPPHRWVRADGLNHYTVMNRDRGASMVADAVRASLTAVARAG
jgi:hypothetical protein